jgi:hypothetical protein
MRSPIYSPASPETGGNHIVRSRAASTAISSTAASCNQTNVVWCWGFTCHGSNTNELSLPVARA